MIRLERARTLLAYGTCMTVTYLMFHTLPQMYGHHDLDHRRFSISQRSKKDCRFEPRNIIQASSASMMLWVMSDDVHILLILNPAESRSPRHIDSLRSSADTLTIIVRSYAVA